MKKQRKNKTYLLIILGVLVALMLTLGISYAYWRLTKEQANENVVKTGCLKLTMNNEANDINLQKAFPIPDSESGQLEPYSFTLTNECDTSADFELGLEILNGSNLSSDYIKYQLGTGDIHSYALKKEIIGSDYTELESSYFATKSLDVCQEFSEQFKITEDYMTSNDIIEECHKVSNDENLYIEEDEYYGVKRGFGFKDLAACEEFKSNSEESGAEIITSCEQPSEIYTFKAIFEMNGLEKKECELVLQYFPENIEKSCDEYMGYYLTYLTYDMLFPESFKSLEECQIRSNEIKEDSIDELIEDCHTNETQLGINNLGKTPMEDEIILQDKAIEGRRIYKDTLLGRESKNFYLRLWMDYDTPPIKEAMNKSLKSKVVIKAVLAEPDILKRVNDTDFSNSKSIWGEYSENINKIIIQDSLNPIEGAELGPFDESSAQDGSIVSYLKQNEEDGYYTAYLQGNGKIILNNNSSYLFSQFSNLQSIEGMNNLDTTQVTDMSYMFYNTQSLENIDLNSFNVSNVTNMESMFENSGLTSLELKDNFKTNKVINMSSMFRGLSNLQTLDISGLNTSNVINMSYMFAGEEYGYNSLLTNIIFGDSFYTNKVTDMSGMFEGLTNLESLDISNFDTNQVTNMSYMFSRMLNLTALTFGDNFNTSSVIDMSHMFAHMENIKELDLSSFNVNNVTNMESMFEGSGLTNLELKDNFKTNKVTNMSSMFFGLSNLQTLDISGLNTSSVTDMSHMFAYMENIKELDLSTFDTNNVTNMESMFESSGLTSLELKDNFKTNKVTNMSSMFSRMSNIQELNLNNLDTSNVTDMSHMFSRMNKIQELDLSHFNTSNVKNMSYMFGDNYSSSYYEYDSILENIIFGENFNTSQVTDMSYMFKGLINLSSLNLSRFDTTQVTNMEGMFTGIRNIRELNLTSFNTSNVTNMSHMFSNDSYNDSYLLENIIFGDSFYTNKVTDMSYMFKGLINLSSLDLSSFDTQNVYNMKGMFDGTKGLQELDLSSFDTSHVLYMQYMFQDMNQLKTLTFGNNFNTSKVTDMGAMFYGMRSLQELDLSNFDTSSVTNMGSMFDGMSNLQTLTFGDNFDTSSVTNMGNMFYGMSSLQELDLSNFDTKNVRFMHKMFYAMENLQTLTFGDSFNTSNVTDMSNMFAYMENIKELDLSSFDTSSVTDMSSMFYGATNLTKITYGSNFIHKGEADTTNMFNRCLANKPDPSVLPSWEGVSFD